MGDMNTSVSVRASMSVSVTALTTPVRPVKARGKARPAGRSHPRSQMASRAFARTRAPACCQRCRTPRGLGKSDGVRVATPARDKPGQAGSTVTSTFAWRRAEDKSHPAACDEPSHTCGQEDLT